MTTGEWVVALVASVLIAIAGVLLNALDLPFVDTLDKHVGDYRIYFGSKRAETQRPEIAIVLITEQTLLDYESRSPIDRKLVAEVIRAVDAAQPKAIGIDLIFDRRTQHDSHLIAAIRETNAPLVLGSIDKRVAGIDTDSLEIQSEFLKAAGRPHGHVMLARKEGMLAATDSVVRFVAPPDEPNSKTGAVVAGGIRSAVAKEPLPALVEVLAAAAQVPFNPASRVIAWQRQPDARTPLFLRLDVPRHRPGDVRRGLEGVVTPVWRELLRDRIVLIGATMIDRDLHLTPLSIVDRLPSPGIDIHAQALAQRIDRREVWTLPLPVVAIVSGLVALTCLIAARRAGLRPHSLWYGPVGLVVIGIASFVAFRVFHIDFPSAALATAWALGGAAGFVLAKWSGRGWFAARSTIGGP